MQAPFSFWRAAAARRWWVGLVLGALLFVALRASGGLPQVVTAEEADAFLGAKRLTEELGPDPAGEDGAERAPFTVRLRQGFATTDSHPRLLQLPPDKSAQRAALEAPVPRWLGALGLGVLHTSDEATNLERTSTAASLAVALAVMLLLAGLARPDVKERWVVAAFALGSLLSMPGVLDAARSSGHGASAILVTTAFALTLSRVVRGGGIRPQLLLGGFIGLALGIHPWALVLWPVVLISWAVRVPAATAGRALRPQLVPEAPTGPQGAAEAEIGQRSRAGATDTAPGALRLPSAPILLYGLPLIALIVLILLWPTLWVDTGKRLGAWLLDFGSTQAAPHVVLGTVFDQSTGRAAQAFTALMQWVAWTPLPVLLLWLAGVAAAVRAGRNGAWAYIITLLGWLVIGSLDGGLFGGRNSLLSLMWVPTAITAGTGASAIFAFLQRRFERRRALGLVALLLVVSLFQGVRGTTLGLARGTGAELRMPVPLELARIAAERRWAIVHPSPETNRTLPGLEVMREGLGLDLRTGALHEADLLLLATSPGAAPPIEVQPRLEGATEVARDPRPGLVVSLWQLDSGARLDKRPALPHN